MLGTAAVLCIVGCATASPRTTVSRVVDGHVEDGPFVSPYAYEWFIEGEVRAAQGQHDEAALAFESATAAPANDVVLLTRLAEEYELSGSSRRADRTLAAARRANPDSAHVALAEGRIERRRGRYREALGAFVRARALAPRWDAPVLAIAETLDARGHRQRAEALLLDYVSSGPEDGGRDARHALTERTRRAGDAESLARAMLLEAELTRTERARVAGELALQRGKPALAARMLEDAIDDEKNVALWLRALARSGDRSRAAEFLRSAEGRRFGTRLDRADQLLALSAIGSAEPLLRAAGPSPRAGYLKGRAVLADGDAVRGAEMFASVPVGAASLEASRLALAECSTLRGRPGAGAETLSRTPHGSLAVRRALAAFYVEQRELRAALTLFDPRSALERAAVAEVFELAGKFDEAAAYYASVESAADPRLRARATSEQLAQRDRHRAAIAVLEPWTETAPEDLYARVRLVELLVADGRNEEAAKRGRATLPLVDDPVLRDRLRAVLSADAVASF